MPDGLDGLGLRQAGQTAAAAYIASQQQQKHQLHHHPQAAHYQHQIQQSASSIPIHTITDPSIPPSFTQPFISPGPPIATATLPDHTLHQDLHPTNTTHQQQPQHAHQAPGFIHVVPTSTPLAASRPMSDQLSNLAPVVVSMVTGNRQAMHVGGVSGLTSSAKETKSQRERLQALQRKRENAARAVLLAAARPQVRNYNVVADDV